MTDRYSKKSRRQMVLDSVHDAVVEMLDYNRDDEPELLEPDGVQKAIDEGDITIGEMASAFASYLSTQLGR